MKQKQTTMQSPGGSLMLTCLAALILITGLCGDICVAKEGNAQSGGLHTDPMTVLHQGENHTITATAESEELGSATLVVNRPQQGELIPYTERNFSSRLEASIAWWKAPAFMDNTTEFRGYQRAPPEKKAEYGEDKQIFFNFIQDSLDAAENESVLNSDRILFRGISPYVAGMVLNNSEYRETAFVSTAYDPGVCLDIFGTRDTEGYQNVLVLERTAGEHALYINEDEREYILPRGSNWIVIKSVTIDNLTVETDFPLFNRTGMTNTYSHVRLIYITQNREKS